MVLGPATLLAGGGGAQCDEPVEPYEQVHQARKKV